MEQELETSSGDEAERDLEEAFIDIDGNCLPWEKPHAKAYPAMAKALSEEAKLPYQQIVREIREVNTVHGTIEYTALVQEMPSFKIPPELKPGKKIDKWKARQLQLIDIVRKARKKALKGHESPYENIQIMLQTLQTNKLIVSALSDAPKYLAYNRLKESGLLSLFDRVIGTRSPGDEHFDPRFHMEKRAFEVSLQESDRPKPFTNLENLCKSTAAEISSSCFMIGNSPHSDGGLCQRYGMLFYHTLWEDGTAEDRKILAEFAPEPRNLFSEQEKLPPIIVHPQFEEIPVEDPLQIIADLRKRGLIE